MDKLYYYFIKVSRTIFIILVFILFALVFIDANFDFANMLR